MGCWAYHNMWLLFIAGLQIGLLTALSPDSTCNPSTEFSCRNDSSICISLSRVKDGRPDCPDKSDEECNEEEFQCQSIHQCIPRERFHDGWPDCDDGSDEECGRGQFRCRCGVPHCIEGSKVKDGFKDCDDGSDEVSGKSLNKTAPCPDESKLQDLLAVEKRRKKRQIHTFGASLEEEDSRKSDETILNLQPSMVGSFSNNFQYSYTKFLNERFSRDGYIPEKKGDSIEDLNIKIETSALGNRKKTFSTKPFMVRTETDSYGSLNSGKIYQTAVNEPISVLPSAEFTLLKFDDTRTEKKLFMKPKKDKNRKYSEHEPRRLSDLMLKIAALFQNDSEVYSPDRSEISDDADLINKTTKSIKNRKLLSIFNDEKEPSNKHVHKRSSEDSETNISHIPLVHSPTVPYMPQSNIHTTGVVMSTTGTDIINGRTTEWTTIIEGTFISGTYAHIVHSTSRIYYTVETPVMTRENINPTEGLKPSNSNQDINSISTDAYINESTDEITEATIQKNSRSQRRNDKSLRADFFDVSSSSEKFDDFQITPTSTLLDVITANEEVKTENVLKTSSSASSILLESVLTEEKDFIFSTSVTDEPELKSTEIMDSVPADPLFIDKIKDISLSEERIMNESGLLNAVGRMVGNQSSETTFESINSVIENSTSKNLSAEINKVVISTPILATKFNEFNLSSIADKTINNSDDASTFDKFNSESSKSELLVPTEILGKDDILIFSIPTSEDEVSSRMETSIGVPDVSDLFAAFMPVSTENTNVEIQSSAGTETHSLSMESVEILPTTSSSISEIFENSEEMLEHTLNVSPSGEVSKFTILSESSLTPESFTVTIPEVKSINEDSAEINLHNPVPTIQMNNSEVMVFLGIASTIDNEEITPSATTKVETSHEDLKASDSIQFPKMNDDNSEVVISENFPSVETSKGDSNEAITVLLMPSMNLDDLKSLMSFSLSSSFSTEKEASEAHTQIERTAVTPSLDDSIFIDSINTDISESVKITTSTADIISDAEETGERVKRAISESVTILRPEGRIVSTDARVYLTPTTLYTTYTYFTTILIPGGGTQIRSSLHVDSVIVEPTDRAVYGYGGQDAHCTECRVRNTAIYDDHETRYVGRPSTPEHYHVETVPYDVGRASEVTYRTTYTYYTTRLRGGTPFVETRKETKTSVTAIPTGRYSPFEIGTYYGGDDLDDHYHTEPPHIGATRPHDITHRTTYTYYTTRIRGGVPTVETRKETKTGVTDIPTYYRPGHVVTQPIRATYSQPIDPNLYKPDRVTHRTTYTYHTTRFRDGVPIVNTRKETETNVTPIPTYSRPANAHRDTLHRVVPSRSAIHYPVVRETYPPHVVHQGSDPYVTHRTTYTYFTTRLIGGSTHVDTRYVTETNVTPNPTVPHVRGTTYVHPNYDAGYNENECPVCREAQRTTVARHTPPIRVRGRNTDRPSRRSEVIDPEVRPSTATLFSTYTYATTQLTRGGRPVVRTREHTVTEVLSDVVLPTLKFGDRIRSKRTVKPEDAAAKNTAHVDHIVPIRHTFSRTNSYADGRQGRRITPSDQNRNRPRTHHDRTPHLNKVDVRNKENDNSHRSQNSDKNDFEIQPTSITYYSTYTYFTTELQDGTPVIKSREHTVTEILTDVIVPTVSAVRRPHTSLATRAYGELSHHRRARDLQKLHKGNALPMRKLLSSPEDPGKVEMGQGKSVTLLQPSISLQLNSETNFLKSEVLSSSKYEFKNEVTSTPSLETPNFGVPENKQGYNRMLQINNGFKLLESDEDLSPAGAEIRRAIIATPVTHYTTYTYYSTKLKPGGSRIIETNTKVASSVIYPHSSQDYYDQVQYTRTPHNKRKLYASRSPQNTRIQSSPYAGRRVDHADTLYGLGSQAIPRSRNPYRRQQLRENQSACTNCNNRFRAHQIPYELTGSYDRITRVQKNNYLTRIPLRNIAGNARRIPDRAPNDVQYHDSNIKPTRVTYYSTYTYFTTEPIDGSSVVRTREHTVTEILTDVIVPTVAALNRVQATAYGGNVLRSKRDSPENDMEDFRGEHLITDTLMKRKLLSLEVENFTADSFLSEKAEFHNFTAIENRNKNITFSESENITLDSAEEKKNFTLLEENLTSTSDDVSKSNAPFQGSEIFNNDTSRFSEVTNKSIENLSGIFLDTNSRELKGDTTENIKFIDLDDNLKEKLISVSLPTAEKNNSELSTSDGRSDLKENIKESDTSKENTDPIKFTITSIIFPTSVINSPDLETISNIPLLKKLDIVPEITNVASEVFSSFASSTNFLGITESSFSPSLTESLIDSSETPSIEKIEFANSDSFHRALNVPESTNVEDLYHREDLDAEGAEIRHRTIATPTTHYTTYTYYSTVLKPGGKSEVITNTKVSTSAYYPDVSTSNRVSHNYYKNEPRSYRNHANKPIRQRNYPRTRMLHDLLPERAIARTQYAYQPSRVHKPYRPTFATTVRRPQYETITTHNINNNRCLSCSINDHYKHDKRINNRNDGKQYLTSVPVRRMTTHNHRTYNTVPYDVPVIRPSYTAANIQNRRTTERRRISYPNTIPYEAPEIKPTRVTYYSTYTYFTTELQDGSPVVRSREHTVTEILTDVVVPTVTSFSHARATKHPNLRGKRYASPDTSDENAFTFRRVLLSIDENNEDIDVVNLSEASENLSTHIFDPTINEDASLENNLLASINPHDISPTVQQADSTPTEGNDDFLSNAQFSKAFAAYLAFLESSGAKPENLTSNDDEILNSAKDFSDSKIAKLSENSPEDESDFTSNQPNSKTKSMTSVLTSNVKRNGRMTKYTTTIYGTYINGVYAQRAESTSDIVPITEMNVPPPVTTLMFSPSRLPGLVRSIVSRKIRGPVAVHLTTEIHGTFVGGAYAQTARVFTSSQPLSSTREPTRHRINSYSTTTIPSRTRKTGLLSTRVLRSKVDGSTTLMFVSEIYGTHIGGAYAHLGTYTTRTIIQTPSSTIIEPEPTSTSLPTYYMEDLTTGLVTASISEKSLNGFTTRYHYQVYGTYLDGTYAHVPSISTETITPRSAGTLSTILHSSLSTTSLESNSSTESIETTTKSISPVISKSSDGITSKIGLIHASTRAHVTNGTTTQHIFEVHGTYLNGNYAHVPSVSVVTIQPSMSSEISEKSEAFEEVVSSIPEDNLPQPDFEILTIFSDVNTESEINDMSPSQKIESFSSGTENAINKSFVDISNVISDNSDANTDITDYLSVIVHFPNSSKNVISDRNQPSSILFPVLLPEALRLSLSHDSSNSRVKRNDPFSPYLRSSFTDSMKNQRETQHSTLIITTPLPTSIFSELPKEFLTNSTKLHSLSKVFQKFPQTKSKQHFDRNTKGKSSTSKSHANPKMKLSYHKRSKRSPAAIRSAFGSSRRFGTSSSSTRKFRSSSTFKRDSSSSTTRGFRPSSSTSSSRNSIKPTKPLLRTYSTSKTVPNFLARSPRSKLSLSSKTSSSSIKPTSSSSKYTLPSIRPRRFGKKEPEKMEEDFEASEAAPKSVTEEKIKPSATSTSRFRRPSKFSKFIRPSTSSVASRSNKVIMPSSSRRNRMQTKNFLSLRNSKNNYRDDNDDIRSTEPVESTTTKRRFTLTTTFEINLKSTAGYLSSFDTDEGNNLQDDNSSNKRRNKNRSSSSSYRNRQGSSYKPVFDSDDNEVRPDKPKSLPLPVFGRSRGVKRPPKFDPRTIKAAATASTSTTIYITPAINETEGAMSETELNGPVTVTDVFTTVKTLPVHLGPRTSFATITTTAYTTSTIQPEDLTFITIGDMTKTLLSAITGFPDANMPADKQFTVVTEILLTTTEIESTSLVAIKVGFGTRTDTIIAKQKLTTLATQTNTILEEKTTSVPFQQQFPYFPNPFAPPIPPQHTDFSLSLSENSFVSTQTVTSTTVLPLFFNGKTVLTTLTSTSLSEETLVKTTTFKVPHQPTLQPFIFPQPVFILPSITTELTVRFTAHNGEIYSIVTQITVPLALNGHTRFARSVTESFINPTTLSSIVSHESSFSNPNEILSPSVNINNHEDQSVGTLLQSSFSTKLKGPLSNEFTEHLVRPTYDNNKNTNTLNSNLESSKSVKNCKTGTENIYDIGNENVKNNDLGYESYNFRKLLQFDGDEIETTNPKEADEYVSLEDAFNIPDTQGSIPRAIEPFTYVPDTFHLIGPGFNEDALNRPIPSVRVVPTRRAYIRRLKPSGSQNLPYEGNEDEFNFRRNNQNFPANINVPPGTEFSPLRPAHFQDENVGLRRPIGNRQIIPQEGRTFGNLRNVQYFSPNRPNQPSEFEGDPFPPARIQPNFLANRPNRLQEVPSNPGRPIANFPPVRNNPPQTDGFDALRDLPSYTPTRQNVPRVPPREESTPNSNQFGEEAPRNQNNRPEPAITATPRRVIRLRRPVNGQQTRPQYGRELLDRKPIVNTLPDEKESVIRARGPVILSNSAVVRDATETNENKGESNVAEYTEPLPLTYYTTFTYMTTFLNGPSTAYSTREAIVSNIATETVNPKMVGLIRSRGGFTQPNGGQTAVPLGSRAQGATTTIVNLASRVQLYNSDVYHGRHSKLPNNKPEKDPLHAEANLRTIPITDIASLPKTYYTLFTYFYTLQDGDKSTHSQRSETISNIDTQTEPFIHQDFASTIDSSGFITLKPNKHLVNLGLRTAGGTTTEVNLELKTIVHFDGLKNAVIDRGDITPTLVEVKPSETNSLFNNYLDPDDAEVQDQQTYPQTVPIQPSFSSANEVYAGTQRSSSNREATPEIPSNSRIVRTQSIRGPLRIASTIRPGTLRSGVFAPRPGVRVRVRPVTSRITSVESSSLISSEPDISSYTINFDPSRTISGDDFDEEDEDTTEEVDSHEEYTTEETKSTEEEENKRESLPGRKRLKITIRRSPGVSASRTNSAFIRPTRTRPRFYVVTRTASPTGGPGRQPKRPVSVKVSRRLRPSGEPEYETYTTMTSVPVVFGLSTTYRNALVTSSSLVTSDVTPEPSKTVVLTYFTTTTYTVPYTVDGVATYTTLEETNSRIATETLDPNADLSFISTTTLDYGDDISASSADLMKHPPQTLKPQLVNNQLNVGPRMNLATKVSNGVTLIVASDGEAEATHIVSQPTVTLRPTVVTDALYMTNKDITTIYEPRTFYTTFTFFTTFFTRGTPSISTSEQVITNVYSVPVTQSITRTQPAHEPFTIIETSENLVSKTLYTTHTFYATLFNGTGTIVTPIEELQSSVISSTETYTITKTIMPNAEIRSSEIKPTQTMRPISTTTTSIYRTRTNYVTLFSGTESIVSPLEEIETDIVTLTLDSPRESYTTRTIHATNTHYITLFNGSGSVLSSITEVAPSVITELVKQLQEPTTTPFPESISIRPTTVISGSSSSVEPVFQDLVPSIRTQYTTLTYFTTLFTDSSTILSSREEVATSYITLFVPAPVPGATKTDNVGTYTSQANLGLVSKPSEIKPSVTPTSEILTFYTTYTYYTTLFRGTETIISDSETVVTQYVTIESTPTDSVSKHTTSIPPTFSRPSYSDSFEIRTEPSTSTVVNSPTFDKGSSESKPDKKASEDDLQIIGVSTKVESDSEKPSILTGIPSTDANGATHILFTDFIVPSSIEDSPAFSTELFSEYVTPTLADLVSSANVITGPSSVRFGDTTFFPHESSTPSSARDSASDLATTRVTDAHHHVATHHMVLHPTTSYQSGSSQTMGIKPGAVIDLSDVLTNTNLVGNLGETIKDIVNLFAANNNRAGKNSTSKSSQSSSDTSIVLPSGGMTVSSAEDPVFIPIGAIARSTKIASSPAERNTEVPILKPSTMLSGFTPIRKDDEKFTFDANNRKIDSVSATDLASNTFTSIVFGSNTIFIQPTSVSTDVPATVLFSDMDGRFHSSLHSKILHGSQPTQENNQQQATPSIKHDESTSIITGHETIFFGFPDARQPPQATTQLIQGSGSTSSIVGYETIFFDSPKDFFVPGSNQVNITGATTIFGTFPIPSDVSTSSTSTPQSTFTSTSSGETTIFFPVPGDNQQQSPGTRYVTSVESVTLTLTLTTSSVYQTEDTPVTVTSVFTTTIPPRTFVSTIIGDRTILGTQPEPTEAVQVIPTMQPSESTTTVTTTTLIFNSIATTVVRTLVIPTNGIQPTRPSTTEATGIVKLGGIAVQPKERPKVTTERTTPRKPIQLFKSGNRPTDPTTPKPLRTGPPLKLFPTKPPTTTPKPRSVTTRKNTFRKPGKTLVPITDGCPRECNLKNKEVCKQNPDKTWSCQCRPGFFRKNGSEECRDVKSFVVLVRVLKMGDNDVTYNSDLSNHLSPEYKNLTTTARKAVDDAYKTSSVGDDFVSTNVLSVARDTGSRQEGVLVNLTVQLSGEKSANEEFLKEELAHSLEAAASDVSIANASVSPIIQRVEDVQDFDECYDDSYNDCSRSAICINLPGSYTCECKDGYQDLEPALPGRFCSGEIKDCDYCNNRGVCIMTEDENKFCRCYRMYLGKQCEINGLVLAIALPIALALLILTMFCLLCGCRKLRQRRAQKPKPNVFKGMVPPMAGTLDRKAMIMDSSSESSGEHRPPPAHAYDGFGDEVANSTMKRSRRSESMDDHISEFQVPTVLIPRAKHSHPKQMIFGPDGESLVGKDICSSYTTLPGRRMSTQSLICETPSVYPSGPRRKGSLCPLDNLGYDSCIAQLNELRDARLPPPACGLGRRRRSSVASSQAALAGSGLAYMSTGSRCHSSLGLYGLEPELWLARRMSMTQSELMNEINLSPTSTDPRQRWSEAGRSFGETTIRASLRQFRTASDFLVPASRHASSRQIASEEQSITEDLMDMSYSDSLMDVNTPNYERLPRREKKRRSSKAYSCYDGPSSLQEYKGK